jgi:hypothetical protein
MTMWAVLSLAAAAVIVAFCTCSDMIARATSVQSGSAIRGAAERVSSERAWSIGMVCLVSIERDNRS